MSNPNTSRGSSPCSWLDTRQKDKTEIDWTAMDNRLKHFARVCTYVHTTMKHLGRQVPTSHAMEPPPPHSHNVMLCYAICQLTTYRFGKSRPHIIVQSGKRTPSPSALSPFHRFETSRPSRVLEEKKRKELGNKMTDLPTDMITNSKVLNSGPGSAECREELRSSEAVEVTKQQYQVWRTNLIVRCSCLWLWSERERVQSILHVRFGR